MRTSEECLAKAVEMQERAAECRTPDLRANYEYMAGYWRSLSCQAVQQEAIERYVKAGARRAQ